MTKQYLKLAKETQCRDYDALVAHATIVFMRYMFLSYQDRRQTDNRTFEELFYTCGEEVADISFAQPLYRIMTNAYDELKKLGNYCEKTTTAFFNAVMGNLFQKFGLVLHHKFVENF